MVLCITARPARRTRDGPRSFRLVRLTHHHRIGFRPMQTPAALGQFDDLGARPQYLRVLNHEIIIVASRIRRPAL